MVITFRWPRSKGTEWSKNVAVSLVGANTKIDGKDGKVTEAYLDSLGDLMITIDIKEDTDESPGKPK